MFDNIYYQTLQYKKYIGLNDAGHEIYEKEVDIKGLRLKGQIKIVESSDGDYSTSTVCYKTPMYIVPNSLINGRTVMECYEVAGMGLNCGFISYVK